MDEDGSIPEGFVSWQAYWASQGMPWRKEPQINAERRSYLTERRATPPDIQRGLYPFRSESGGITLTRADVEWLLATHENERGPVYWEDTTQRLRDGIDLRGAILKGEDLSALPLARLRAGLVGEEWRSTNKHLHAIAAAQLQASNLISTHLEGSSLTLVQFQGAILTDAHLESADLFEARFDAPSPGSLRLAYFDSVTKLQEVKLADSQGVSARLVDAHWNGVNLSSIDWTSIRMLGDEYRARQTREQRTPRKKGQSRMDYLQEAVRANRQIATVLRAQGLNEDADRFAYRAQVLQRTVLRRQGIQKWPAYLRSLLLWVLAGYGYRLWRIFAAYAFVLLVFAATYFLMGIPGEPAGDVKSHALDAFLISLTAIHGRVFFEQFGFTLQAWVAAIESVSGIVIEGVFVAMLIQRWFQQ